MCEQCCLAGVDDHVIQVCPQCGRETVAAHAQPPAGPSGGGSPGGGGHAIGSASIVPPSPTIHPGQVLMEDYLRPMGLSIRRLAEAIRVKRGRLESVIGGRSAISTELSMRLGRYFGDAPLYWVDLQVKHEREMADCAWGEDIELIRPRVRW